MPSGSLEDEKNKRATQILSDHVYRQHPDKFKFSSLMDSIPMVLAKNNAITMNHVSPLFAEEGVHLSFIIYGNTEI